jgi:hypothetical protein
MEPPTPPFLVVGSLRLRAGPSIDGEVDYLFAPFTIVGLHSRRPRGLLPGKAGHHINGDVMSRFIELNTRTSSETSHRHRRVKIS